MPPLYVAGLYGASRVASLRGNLRQVVVVDVLLVNWLVCEFARLSIDGQQLPAAFLAVDIVSALWLSFRIRGVAAALAEIFFVAQIIFNSAFFFAHAFDEWTHWIGLSILSWGQLLAVSGGILRHDLVEITRRAVSRLGLRGYLALGSKETDQ